MDVDGLHDAFGRPRQKCLRHRQDAGRENRCREKGNEDGGVDGDGDDHEGRSSLIHISVGHRRSAKVPRQRSTRRAKHIVHHRSRQLAGVRILSAWVIAPDQGLTVAQGVNRPMRELRARPDDLAAELEQLKIRIERDLAERDDHLHARERRNLRVEMRKASGDLFRARLVVRRRAANGRGDKRVGQV